MVVDSSGSWRISARPTAQKDPGVGTVASGYHERVFRIALANLRYPRSPADSVTLAEQAIAEAGRQQARIICFPEGFVPGYRGMGRMPPCWVSGTYGPAPPPRGGFSSSMRTVCSRMTGTL